MWNLKPQNIEYFDPLGWKWRAGDPEHRRLPCAAPSARIGSVGSPKARLRKPQNPKAARHICFCVYTHVFVVYNLCMYINVLVLGWGRQQALNIRDASAAFRSGTRTGCLRKGDLHCHSVRLLLRSLQACLVRAQGSGLCVGYPETEAIRSGAVAAGAGRHAWDLVAS